jgi:hypothetical protein
VPASCPARILLSFDSEDASTSKEVQMERKERNGVESNPESGKIGKAFLLWLLGVPGIIIVAYLIFGH